MMRDNRLWCVVTLQLVDAKGSDFSEPFLLQWGAPNRIRTGVTGLKSPCPRPLDDGGKRDCKLRIVDFGFGLSIHNPNQQSAVRVTPPRLERGTYSLEGCCSIQLSYGAGFRRSQRSPLAGTRVQSELRSLPCVHRRENSSRGDRIRTCDFLVPNQAL